MRRNSSEVTLANILRFASDDTLAANGLRRRDVDETTAPAENSSPVPTRKPTRRGKKPRRENEDAGDSKRRIDYEDQEMIEFRQMTEGLAAVNPDASRWFHVPNGGFRDVKVTEKGTYSPTGVKLKAMGARKGILDVFFLSPRGPYIGFVADMKWGNNKLSAEQSDWMEWFGAQGFLCEVAYSAGEMFDKFRSYLEMEK